MTDIVGPASAANAVTSRPSDGRQWGNFDTWFRDCTSPSTQDGTQVSAAWLNGVTGFFRNLIRGPGLKLDGVTPVVPLDQSDNMVLNAILQLIQRGQANFALDKGTPDALLATAAVAPAEYLAGMRFLILKNPTVGANATAAPTVNFGLGNLTIVKNDGSTLGIGDLKKGGVFEVELDGAGHACLTALLTASDILALIAANAPVPAPNGATLYVRTDGNDVNNGSANTASSAFQTIAAAITYGASKFFLAGKPLTIQLGIPGTYAAPGAISQVPNLIIRGDPANQSNYIISGAGPAAGGSALVAAFSSAVNLIGVTITNTGAINHSVSASAGSQVAVSNVTFTGTVTTNYAHMSASGAASFSVGSGCIINGGTFGVVMNSTGSASFYQAAPLTLQDSPAWTSAFVYANVNGSWAIASGVGYSGTGTGPRYIANLNGVINTMGQGANFLPGNSAGATATGGQYF